MKYHTPIQGLKCHHCQKETNRLNQVQADIVQSEECCDWHIDLILACPHCGQQYSIFIPTSDLLPLEA